MHMSGPNIQSDVAWKSIISSFQGRCGNNQIDFHETALAHFSCYSTFATWSWDSGCWEHPLPLSFSIQGFASILILSNNRLPSAHCDEMAELPCIEGYYSLVYSAGKITVKNTFRKIRQNWEKAIVRLVCQNLDISADLFSRVTCWIFKEISNNLFLFS